VQNVVEKVIEDITTAEIKEIVSTVAPITTADVTPDELTMAQALKSKPKGDKAIIEQEPKQGATTTTTITIPTPDSTRPKAKGVVMQEPSETPTTTTIPISLKWALNEENVPTQPNDPPLSRVNTLKSRKDNLKLNELMKLCTKLSDRVLNLETTKSAQAKEISSWKRRVKILKKKKRSRTHRLKRLYKVGLSARVESSAEEQSLGEEDASKQGRNIADIDADVEITLVNETAEDQGRFDDQEMFDTSVLDDEE
nr:hypothetical protein [Tanacetum cinerariifolium]